MSNETKTNGAVEPRAKLLPSLIELSHDPVAAFNNDQLNLLLNQPVPQDWLKDHPTAKKKNDQGHEVPMQYIAIDRVEFLLTRIFQQWHVEVLREGVMFQSVYVTVRLHYRNPLTGDWHFHDGVGAVAVQTNKGKSAADLAEIKSAAVQMALPAAKSYATKDAAENLGILFGKDINRKDTFAFVGAYSKEDEIQKAANAIKDARNI
jgi:hypothetical protein